MGFFSKKPETAERPIDPGEAVSQYVNNIKEAAEITADTFYEHVYKWTDDYFQKYGEWPPTEQGSFILFAKTHANDPRIREVINKFKWSDIVLMMTRAKESILRAKASKEEVA